MPARMLPGAVGGNQGQTRGNGLREASAPEPPSPAPPEREPSVGWALEGCALDAPTASAKKVRGGMRVNQGT
jgi:hypothetical protein